MSSDDEQATCSICDGDKSTKRNPIIFCDGKDCDMPVHKICYKVDEIPDDDWYCQRCENKRKKRPTNIICCPMQTGAIKRTASTGEFIHVVCAMWNKAIDDSREPYIVPIKQLNRHECYYCYKKKGFTIQCEEVDCAIFFHATCAINNGIINPASTVPSDFSPRCGKHLAEYERRKTKSKNRPLIETISSDSEDTAMKFEDDEETEDESEEKSSDASGDKKQKASINKKKAAKSSHRSQQQQQQQSVKRERSPNLVFTDDSDDDMCLNNGTNDKHKKAPTSISTATKINSLAITSQKPTQQNNSAYSNNKDGSSKTKVIDETQDHKERLDIKRRKTEHQATSSNNNTRPSLKIEDSKLKSSNSTVASSSMTKQKPVIGNSSSNIIPSSALTPPLKKTSGPGIIKDIAEIRNDIKADAQRWNLNASGNSISMNRNQPATPTTAKAGFLENDRKMMTNDEKEEFNRLNRRFAELKRNVTEIFTSLNLRLPSNSAVTPERDIEAYVAQLQQIVKRAGPIRDSDIAVIQDCVRSSFKQRE